MKKTNSFWIVLVFIIIASIGFGILQTKKIKADTPPSEIDITFKDFILTKTEDGMDHVEIEDGFTTDEIDKPVVPFYQKKYLFSKDFAIQTIELLEKSDVKEGTGLKIPNYKFETDMNKDRLYKMAEGEWYPLEFFKWDIDENLDGSKLLILSVYPFSYNSTSTDYKYYKNFKFHVTYINTFAHITSFESEKPEYNPKDTVHFLSKLDYTDSSPGQLIASVIIEDERQKVLDSLPIKELNDIPTGEVTVNFDWNNEKELTGYLFAKLEIKNNRGELLDFRRIGFSMGIADAKITEFSVSPDRIKPNDPVSFTVKMLNTGSIEISGRLEVKITDETSEIKTFSLAFDKIKPQGDFGYSDTWQTSEAKLGKKYFLSARAYFNSMSSEPMIKFVSLNTPPVADFTFNPSLISTGTEISFDATLSTDLDGEITEYLWNFDDDSNGSGKVIQHIFYEPGTYQVRLTVIDNAGDASQRAKTIEVKSVKAKTIIRLFIGKKTYFVNDISKEMDTEPMILEGRTLLPIRYVAEAIGAKVGWIQAEKKATIDLLDTHIELWIGNNMAKINGESKPIDSTNPKVKPIVIPPGRTMLPIRFVAENLGCQVEWIAETREVKITYPKP